MREDMDILRVVSATRDRKIVSPWGLEERLLSVVEHPPYGSPVNRHFSTH